MTKGEYRAFVQMWTKDPNAFGRWLSASAVVGSIFVAAIVIMVLSVHTAPGPTHAAAVGTDGIDISASRRHRAQGTMLPYGLTHEFCSVLTARASAVPSPHDIHGHCEPPSFARQFAWP
jgi:hypothetical protein